MGALPPDFAIDVRREPDGTRLVVRGEVDLSSVGALREGVSPHQGSGGVVIFDLSDVAFIDSTGLHALLQFQADSRRDGWQMVVDPALAPPVGRLIELTGVRNLLEWLT